MNSGPLMTIEELSEFLQVPVKTLYDWRHRGLGPAGMRVGRHVRYRQADVDAWLDRCLDESGNSTGGWVAHTAR